MYYLKVCYNPCALGESCNMQNVTCFLLFHIIVCGRPIQAQGTLININPSFTLKQKTKTLSTASPRKNPALIQSIAPTQLYFLCFFLIFASLTKCFKVMNRQPWSGVELCDSEKYEHIMYYYVQYLYYSLITYSTRSPFTRVVVSALVTHVRQQGQHRRTDVILLRDCGWVTYGALWGGIWCLRKQYC